ncbi:hypothetical protein DFH11DRAFT_1721770 [Phellopilus nigrolimitatus]|nr:hypothetical protein DFH11DRAFT_1721770 [Phellopilus nigrolimitatus]
MPRAARQPRQSRQSRPQPAHLGYGTNNCADEFLRQFTAAQSTKQRQKEHLTAQQHAALRDNADLVVSLRPAWADNTKFNVAGILKKWKAYCEAMDLGEETGGWEGALRTAQKGTAMDFLVHLCEKCDIKSSGTCWQYFRQWKQLYNLTVGRHMDTNDSNEVHKFFKTYLIPKFHLEAPSLRLKTVTESGDLLALLTFNFAYDHRVFPSERQRLDVAGCYLILAYTGCRPAEVVDGEKSIPMDGCWDELFGDQTTPSSKATSPDTPADQHSKEIARLLDLELQFRNRPKALCYEDVQFLVIRHPETGADTLTMSIKFTHHKGADNRPKPTVFYFTPTRRLIFCLVTLMASIAVLDGAFDSPTLSSVEAVFRVRTSGPVTCVPLRWKKEWLKRPVFRRWNGDLDSPLPYRTLHDYMGRQSLDMGYEKPIGPKDWRRNVGNTVNGQASDAVRDQVMRHNNHSNVFQDAYLNAHVQFDVQNAVLGEPLQDRVLSMLSHVGHTRDPRASGDMVPDEVWDLLPEDPEIEQLERRREELKGNQFRVKGSPHEKELQRLTRLISSRRAKRKKMVKDSYRLYYFHNRPTWDVERQANGEAPVEDQKAKTDLQLPDRADLAKLLCDQPDGLGPEDLHQRRIAVGTSMVKLGRLEEPIRREIRGFLGILAGAASPAGLEGASPASDDDLDHGASLSPPSSSPNSLTDSSSFDGGHTSSPSLSALSDDSTSMQSSTIANLDYDVTHGWWTREDSQYTLLSAPNNPPLQYTHSYAPRQPLQRVPPFHSSVHHGFLLYPSPVSLTHPFL